MLWHISYFHKCSLGKIRLDDSIKQYLYLINLYGSFYFVCQALGVNDWLKVSKVTNGMSCVKKTFGWRTWWETCVWLKTNNRSCYLGSCTCSTGKTVNYNWQKFVTSSRPKGIYIYIEDILPKGPYLPCVSMAARALLAGYHRYICVCELRHHWLK